MSSKGRTKPPHRERFSPPSITKPKTTKANGDQTTFRLEIVDRPTATLRPDPKNSRKHSKEQIAKIARSIQTFGFNVPLLVDRNLKVLAGHARLLACQKLGQPSVPTIALGHLTETEARAFLIADNRLAEIAAWDEKILATELRDLSALKLDFDLDAIGFDIADIDLRIQSLEDDDPDDRADELPEAGPAVSRLGDIWQLGAHRILCGNALDADSFTNLLEQERADLVFVDPPYNVKIDGHATGLGKTRHREFAMAVGEMSEIEFTRFLTTACDHLASFSKAGAVHFVCMDWRHAGELLAAGKVAYSALLNICVWAKSNAGMGSMYRSQHELIFVFKAGKAKHRNNVQLGQYGRNRTNVWNYPGANTFGRKGDEGNLLTLHPTVKPVALVADAILDASPRNGLVVDSFLGSGSTLIAAEKTGRRCIGIELDPVYVDTAIRRWQSFTEREAVLVSTGATFKATERERNDA
ncbi:MAG: ParB N-terminal domain-containing protein [Proteobacteria bacterium]|nr:ParB N-terminal domain-containing protein [Pseudomonadota bacterium]